MRFATLFGRTAVAIVLAATAVFPAHAAESRDHDRARQALQAGEILPLRSILDRVERDTPGQVIEVELDREAGRWVYEIKVLATGGAIVKLELDARDGTVLRRRAEGERDRKR